MYIQVASICTQTEEIKLKIEWQSSVLIVPIP